MIDNKIKIIIIRKNITVLLFTVEKVVIRDIEVSKVFSEFINYFIEIRKDKDF